jgi:hypothetical protein
VGKVVSSHAFLITLIRALGVAVAWTMRSSGCAMPGTSPAERIVFVAPSNVTNFLSTMLATAAPTALGVAPAKYAISYSCSPIDLGSTAPPGRHSHTRAPRLAAAATPIPKKQKSAPMFNLLSFAGPAGG